MNTWGHALRLSVFGESHGKAVGIVVDGLPAGETVDMDALARDMARRAPGRDEFSTARREADTAEILSGLHEGRTTGAPVCGVIFNRDARPGDYDRVLRPGHADWTALLKYRGHADMRGGGHFSGRLTAPLVFAGALARQALARRGVRVHAKIAAIGGVPDAEIPCTPDAYGAVAALAFPVADAAAAEAMRRLIRDARAEGDSVGGVVEAVAFGLPGGLGEPFFASVESALAALLFSVPAVKGVEFGDGFRLASMRGSEANDALCARDGRITALSNHNGGLLGGITNGMPVVVRAAVKPTPSIAREQQTVDADGAQTVLSVRGRHDACIVPRAVPVVEACLALCALDALLTADRAM
jgi:chorismate synthase